MSIFASIAGALISAGSNLIGSKIASDKVSAGNDALIAAIMEGQRLALEEIRSGKLQAFEFMAPLLESGAAGTQVLRREAQADPSRLTAAQQRGLEDVTRRSQNQLATSGLRGAGRTQSRVLRDVTGDFVANAQETNRSRALDAANRLFGAGVTGRQVSANAATGAGTQAANTISNAFRSIGGSEAVTGAITGQIGGNAALATGNVIGGTLGTIAGQIAEDTKRTGAFGNFKSMRL